MEETWSEINSDVGKGKKQLPQSSKFRGDGGNVIHCNN